MVTEEYFWSDELQQYCVVYIVQVMKQLMPRDADDERLLTSFNSRPSTGN